MQINSAMGNALLGIQRGLNGLERNSAEIASAKQMTGEGDLTKPLVETRVNQRYTEANIKVLETAHDTLGTILDLKA